MTSLQLVQKAYDEYLLFEKTYKDTEQKHVDAATEYMKSMSDEASFKKLPDEILNIMNERPYQKSDLTNSAMKFINYATFHQYTSEEELPENVRKDLDGLKQVLDTSYKFTIQNGEFIAKEDLQLDVALVKSSYEFLKSTLNEYTQD